MVSHSSFSKHPGDGNISKTPPLSGGEVLKCSKCNWKNVKCSKYPAKKFPDKWLWDNEPLLCLQGIYSIIPWPSLWEFCCSCCCCCLLANFFIWNEGVWVVRNSQNLHALFNLKRMLLAVHPRMNCVKSVSECTSLSSIKGFHEIIIRKEEGIDI